MNIVAIITNLRFQDALDILFLTLVAYHLYLWFRGTKAFKAFVGLLILGVVFTIARTWGLFMTTWFFQILWQVLVILLIILFQSEIRQALERVNPLQIIGLHKMSKPDKWVLEFTQAVFALAQRKIGALLIIERQDRAEEFVTAGQALEADPNFQVLMSIFHKESPLHDGAVIIKEGRIAQAACYLPLSPEEGLPKEWGTRHRAGLGLSERCDAWVIVVSEEYGRVSLARRKRMDRVASPEELSKLILEAVRPFSARKITWPSKIWSLFSYRWPVKLGALCLVSVLWLLLAGQQDFEVTLDVPLNLKGLATHLTVAEPLNPKVNLRVRGLRKDASILNENNVRVEIDASQARSSGRMSFFISRDLIHLPDRRVQIVDVQPGWMMFTFQEKPSK
ncbi:MAG: diadenylate cyclase CdaA [Desulfobacterales bacterium]|nr:diadenylate cyclase CdaA [Desulfobacterales bacterium]